MEEDEVDVDDDVESEKDDQLGMSLRNARAFACFEGASSFGANFVT